MIEIIKSKLEDVFLTSINYENSKLLTYKKMPKYLENQQNCLNNC